MKNIYLFVCLIWISSCTAPKQNIVADSKCLHPLKNQNLLPWKKRVTLSFQVDSLVFEGQNYPKTEPKLITLYEGMTHVTLDSNLEVSFHRFPAFEYGKKLNLLEYEVRLLRNDSSFTVYRYNLDRLAYDCQHFECHKEIQTLQSQKHFIRNRLILIH